MMVVVVENEPDIRSLVARVLEHHKVPCGFCPPQQAMDPAMWEGASHALVDLALGVPEFSGVDVLVMLEARLPSVRRMMFTAHYEMAGAAAGHAEMVVPKMQVVDLLPKLLGL